MWPRLVRDGDEERMRRTGVVAQATMGLVGAALGMLDGAGAMESNPDVAQDFFGYLTKVRRTFRISGARLIVDENRLERISRV